MRRNVIMILIGLVFIVGIAGRTLIASAQDGLPQDIHLEDIGLRFGTPKTAPRLTRIPAIELAKGRVGAAADQAANVEARHVLFNNDHQYSEDVQGRRHYAVQNIPAWVVTFSGINFPLVGARGQAPIVNHEVHVAIHAETGEFIQLFTYR
jgi:hypothetical protein